MEGVLFLSILRLYNYYILKMVEKYKKILNTNIWRA